MINDRTSSFWSGLGILGHMESFELKKKKRKKLNAVLFLS